MKCFLVVDLEGALRTFFSFCNLRQKNLGLGIV